MLNRWLRIEDDRDNRFASERIVRVCAASVNFPADAIEGAFAQLRRAQEICAKLEHGPCDLCARGVKTKMVEREIGYALWCAQCLEQNNALPLNAGLLDWFSEGVKS